MMLSTADKKLFITIVAAFIIVSHPKTYGIVSSIFKKVHGPPIITSYGCPTLLGLILHALVCAVVVLGVSKLRI